MFVSKAATVTLALLPGALSACLNDQTYKYPGSVSRPCSNIRIKESRRQKLCLLDEVREACPQTCGLCCDDDPDFMFPLEKVKGAERPCEWISINDKHVDTRQGLYCGLDYFIGTTTIRNMCPFSCDFVKRRSSRPNPLRHLSSEPQRPLFRQHLLLNPPGLLLPCPLRSLP